MKMIKKTFLPDTIISNNITYVCDYELSANFNGTNFPREKGIIGVNVLSKNLNGKTDLHGKDYTGTFWIFKQDLSKITPKVSDKFEIGAILSSSWGYDQTNASFYMIVSLTNSFATVIPMKNNITGYANGSNNVVPAEIDTVHVDKYGLIRKKIQHYSGKPSLEIHEFESAYLWDGKEVSSDSSYR